MLLLMATALLTTLTLLRNYDYRSELALWRDVAEKAPHNPRGQYNYGVYLQLADPPQYDDAIRQYRRTLELDRNYADAHLNLGSLAAFRKEWPQAKQHYERLRELQPTNAAALYGIAQAAEQLGDPLAARIAVERLLEVDANHVAGKSLMARLDEAGIATEPR